MSEDQVDCRFGLELTRSMNQYDVSVRPQSWRMQVSVSAYFNVDPNIFLYMVTGRDPETNEVQAAFQSVCSPTDLEEYPLGPQEGSSSAPADGESENAEEPSLFFRMSSVDLVSRNRALLDETWSLIQSDRDELLRTLEHMAVLEVSDVSRGGLWEGDDQPMGAR